MAQLAREDMTVVAMVVNNHVHVVIADDDGNAGFSESGLVPPEAVKGIRGEFMLIPVFVITLTLTLLKRGNEKMKKEERGVHERTARVLY